jgi:putative ABC transport system permease protein
MRALVHRRAPDAPRVEMSIGREVIARDLGQLRLGAWFFSGFGVVALVLGAGGVFGLVAYLFESRRREFGIRLALGATPRALVRYGLAVALIPVSIGVIAGVLTAIPVTRSLASFLIGVTPLDPATYAGVAVAILAPAAAAALAAAWRLGRVAPSEARDARD